MDDDVIRGATVLHDGKITFPPPKPKIVAIAKHDTKKIKEKSAYLDNLNTEFENYIVSSKTNENIFEIQKKIFEFL